MFTMVRELRFFRTKIKKWECMFFRLRGRGRFFFLYVDGRRVFWRVGECIVCENERKKKVNMFLKF